VRVLLEQVAARVIANIMVRSLRFFKFQNGGSKFVSVAVHPDEMGGYPKISCRLSQWNSDCLNFDLV
jgi:hypothetical protein